MEDWDSLDIKTEKKKNQGKKNDEKTSQNTSEIINTNIEDDLEIDNQTDLSNIEGKDPSRNRSPRRTNIKKELEELKTVLITTIKEKNQVTFQFDQVMENQIKKIIKEELLILKTDLENRISGLKENPRNLELDIILSFIRNYHLARKLPRKTERIWITRRVSEIANDLKVIEDINFKACIENMIASNLLKVADVNNRYLITEEAIRKYPNEIKNFNNEDIEQYIIDLIPQKILANRVKK